MYLLSVFEITDELIHGVDGYEEFEYSVIPEVGQWLSLPNKDGDEEHIFKVTQVIIPLRQVGGNLVEIYTVRFEDNRQAYDAMYQLKGIV